MLVTGALSDRVGRKDLIASGMWVQAAGIFLVVVAHGFARFAAGGYLADLRHGFAPPRQTT